MKNESAATERLCAVCTKRPGTVKWSDSAMSVVHGFFEWRCPRCAARAQLRHALGRAAAIPKLVWKAVAA